MRRRLAGEIDRLISLVRVMGEKRHHLLPVYWRNCSRRVTIESFSVLSEHFVHLNDGRNSLLQPLSVVVLFMKLILNDLWSKCKT
jgi:hypothetical protein